MHAVQRDNQTDSGRCINMTDQLIFECNEDYTNIKQYFHELGCTGIFLVCGSSIQRLAINSLFQELEAGDEISVTRFSDFKPNPDYESVVKGVRLFRENSCDAIVAIGGGSAIDVAKCIKLFSQMPTDGENGEWLSQKYTANDIPLIVMPTTAGTGSEATRYAVIYYEGNKQSITDISIIPGTILFDVSALNSLPMYQRKATMCDALSHAIESMWSLNSTDESMEYSESSIMHIIRNMDGYLANTYEGNYQMLMASYTAGKAINITQTTAGHAMCYKITGLFGCAHGHSAMLCNRVLYDWNFRNIDKCRDSRGKEYLLDVLNRIGIAMDCTDAKTGIIRLNEIFDKLDLEIPKATKEQFEILESSVNSTRLKNHPVELDDEAIRDIYHMVLRETN